MKGFWFTLLFLVTILLVLSCSSTKKNIVQGSRVEQELITSTKRELVTDLGELKKKTIITEVVRESYEVVAGTDQVQPTKTVTTTTEVIESENKNTTNQKAIEGSLIKLETFDSLTLNRETEGIEVVEEIVGGITGTFFGGITKWIIGTIFFVILLIFVKSLLKKRSSQI